MKNSIFIIIFYIVPKFFISFYLFRFWDIKKINTIIKIKFKKKQGKHTLVHIRDRFLDLYSKLIQDDASKY